MGQEFFKNVKKSLYLCSKDRKSTTSLNTTRRLLYMFISGCELRVDCAKVVKNQGYG